MTFVTTAEIVGTVLAVFARPGDHVTPGDTLGVLESMKMEIPVLAERAGTVAEVLMEAGRRVTEGERLVVVELPATDARATQPDA